MYVHMCMYVCMYVCMYACVYTCWGPFVLGSASSKELVATATKSCSEYEVQELRMHELETREVNTQEGHLPANQYAVVIETVD